jgi:uncharacterized protein
VDFNERLRRLGVLRGVDHLKSSPPPAHRHLGIEHWVPGQVIQNDRGSFFLADTTFPLDHLHGERPLSSLLNHAPETLARLTGDETLTDLDLRRAAFIDTETTGLAGGTGTYAFLIGVGHFEEDHFRLRQYFMRDFGEEPAMLHHLAGTLKALNGLVTFNGKAFDLPLLETRFLLARLRPDLLSAPHLDLLFPARCLWRARISSCALSSLEQNVLGVRRNGQDVPGFLIPAMYFNYLQTGDATEISRIFYHNAQDILSMITLSTQVCWLFHSPACGEPAHGLDLLSLGRLCERLGRQSEGEQAYRHALSCAQDPDVRALLQEQLSFVCKREGRWAEAVELWEALCESGCATITPHVELAKYYEHRAADIDRAMAFALEARKKLPRMPPGARPAESRSDLEYRLSRLRRKKERHTAQP